MIETNLTTESFITAMKVLLIETRKYLRLYGHSYYPDVTYKGQEVGKIINKQLVDDWDGFVEFIRNRTDKDLVEELAKDYPEYFTN